MVRDFSYIERVADPRGGGHDQRYSVDIGKISAELGCGRYEGPPYAWTRNASRLPLNDSSGSAEFGIGIIDKGKRPTQPFNVHGNGRITYENARVEVHQNERDFVGPIEIDDDGRALFLTAGVDGLPIDLMILDRTSGEQSLRYFLDYAQVGPLAGQPLLTDSLQPGVPYNRTFPVPKGQYYVVFDNSASAGNVAPPNNPLDDRMATVSYAVQIGDAP